MHHRHGQLLPADGVYLLAEYLLDLLERPLRQRKVREYAGGELADIAGAERQLMRGNLGIGWCLAQGRAEQFRSRMAIPFD